MALTPANQRAGTGREGAPSWVVPVYVGGLILLYAGERIFGTMDSVHTALSGLGALAVLAATAARFVPTWQAGGERGRIEKLLGILSLVGLAAVALYFLSTDWGLAKIGVLTASNEKRDRVHGLLTIGWVVLVCASVVPMLFAEAALAPQRNAERLESRRVRAAATAGLTLALAAVYGALFVYSATGTDWKVDFSYFKTSEPSASTRKLVEGLNQPIRVVAFFPEVSPVRYEVERYLKQLAVGASNLKVEMADRYLDPKLAKEMKVVQDGTIIIEKGESKRLLNIGTEMKDAAKNLKTLDRDFQERLYKLLREHRTLYLTVGHGEINDDDVGAADKQDSGRTTQILKMLLGKQNYTTKTLGLTQGLATEVPEDADVVAVLGPTQPFAPEELQSIERYAKRGGKLLLALDPDAISTDDVDTEHAGKTETPGSKPVAVASASAKPTEGAAATNDKGDKKPKEDKKPKDSNKPDDKKPEKKPVEKKAEAPAASASAAPAAAPPSTVSPGTGTVGTLEALAAIVGVQFTPTVLANDKQFARRRYDDSDHTLIIANRFSSHPSVSTLSRNSSRAAVVVAGAGSVLKAPGSSVKADVAVRVMSSTFQDLNGNYHFDESVEHRDSYGLAVAVSEPVAFDATAAPKEPPKAEKKDIPIVTPPNEMRAFVVADADVFTDVAMSNFMANQMLVMDALRWLGGEESLAGEVNSEEDIKIEHTQQKDLVWFYATIFGAPALILGLGLTYSRRSRQRRGGKA